MAKELAEGRIQARMTHDRKRRFSEAAARTPGKDVSTLLNEFAAWFTREPGAKMPVRPPAAKDGEDG